VTLDTPSETRSERLWRLIAADPKVFVGIVLAFVAVATVLVFVVRPVYRATVLVLPAQSKSSVAKLGAALGGIGSLGSLVGLAVGDDENTVEAQAILKSRAFTEEFIRSHDLTKRLYERQWDAQRNVWKPDWLGRVPTLYDAYKKFDRKVRHVAEDHKTGMIILEIDWPDAEEGARWANEMIRTVNDVMRKRAMTEADASIDMLEAEMKNAATVELQTAIAHTIETYVKTRALARVRPDYAYRVVDPAEPTGPRDYVSPQRSLDVAGAGILGAIVGIAVLLWRERRRVRRDGSPADFRLRAQH
jgi:uncharacterized protein involved in exopolysaccharide biosynthesis